jgi:hypothetical protein
MTDDRHSHDGIEDGRVPGDSPTPGDSATFGGSGAPDADLDDRLLALALGLDDDPELRAQLEQSAELRARFERLQDELSAVEDGVRRAVPEEPEGWADLSQERWSALKPYVSTGQTPAADRRRGSWWRRWQTLAPVAATLVIAVAVLGVVMSRDGMMSLQGADESGGGSEMAPEKTLDGEDYDDAAQPGVGAASSRLTVAGAEAYRIVVVARAGDSVDGAQSYAVERTLKGDAPGTVMLQTEVDGELPAGTPAVLFLDPVNDTSPCPVPTVLSEENGQATDASSPPANATGDGLRQAGSLYLYDGRCAVVVSLPDGMDPADVDVQ